MQLNPHIFREYDVRGTVDVDLSNDFAYLLGRGYATLARDEGKNNIAVGFDCRHSSEGYARAIAKGLSDEGVDCTIVGMGPTPQLYYSIYALECGGGIQVTGSHNPPDMNGFKICIGTLPLWGDLIQDLKRRMEALPEKPAGEKRGTIREEYIRDRYVQELIENVRPHMGKRKLKIVVDAGNGVGGLVGVPALRGLGVEMAELYTDPDGDFPNHHPDPTVMKNIQDLIAKVRETGADFGIGWDGDGDRIGVVDENGQVIFGDMLLLIYARALMAEVPKPTIIADVKCSSLLFEDLEKRGARAIMWKTGHSLIKNKLREEKGELGGEMSGHICFKHRYYGFDDALYCSVRFAELVSNTDKKVSELLADLPKMYSTPEIRTDCPENIKFLISEKAKDAFAGYKVDTIDGVRVTFEHGWALVRASNTQPVLVMRFEADSEQRLVEYQSLVQDKIEAIKRSVS